MWSDNETDIDLLGFQHLKAAVRSIATDDTLLPATIGVYGDWGSGKTSLMRMVCADLEREPDTLVLWFNGWLFEGFDDAKTALMGSIIDEIVARRPKWTGTKEKAGRLALKLLRKLPLFKLLGVGSRVALGYAAAGKVGAAASLAADGLAGGSDLIATAQKLTENVDDLSADDVFAALDDEDTRNVRRSVREFHEDFAALLEAAGIKRLVVFIDDLDRCVPDTIIETLEAIKLFLFAPKTAFIIGADERLVQYAVRRRFPELPGERVDVGRDYLEKLVQFAVRVPPLGRAEMETYINLLFCKKAAATPAAFEAARKKAMESDPGGLAKVRFDHAEAAALLGTVSKNLAESLSISQRIAPFFAAQLTGNPRQCKRFLNLLLLRQSMAKSRGVELQQRVLAKLMLLEQFRNPSFRSLADAQAAEDGKPNDLVTAERAVAVQERATSSRGGKKGKAGSGKADVDGEGELAEWLRDDWIRTDWLTQEPKLGGIDLGPYFYFSRDKLGGLAGAAQRLSTAAKDVLADLFDASEAVRDKATTAASGLSSGDAAAVFEAVEQKAREEDDASGEDSALSTFCNFAAARPDLVNQFLLAVGRFSLNGLPVWLPSRVKQIAGPANQGDAALALLKRWNENAPVGAFKTAVGQQMR